MDTILLSIEPNDLETILIDAETIQEIYRDRDLKNKLNLKESASILHFLLTGKESGGEAPLSFTIFGEYPFVHIQTVVESAKYNSAVIVAEIAEALHLLSTEEIKRRFEQEEFKRSQLYHHLNSNNLITLELLLENFIRLKFFYGHAHENNQAVISLQVSEGE